MVQLKRSLGLYQAASIGIAQVIGVGIFVLSGVAAGIAGPSVLLSFIIAGLIAMLTALSSIELSSFITEAGGSYIYTKYAFGRFWSFVVGWFKYFDYIVGAASAFVGFTGYFSAFFGIHDTSVLLIVTIAMPVFFIILNFIGISETAEVTTFMVFIKIFALCLLLFVGGYYLKNNFEPSHYEPFFVTGFSGTLHGSTIIFSSFLGFNTILMMSEETKKPESIIPKAIFLTFFTAFFFYIAIVFLEIGVLNWRTLGFSSDPLSLLAKTISDNQIFFEIISFSGLVAIGSVSLSSITGGTRLGFVMGRDGLLPKSFQLIHNRFKTPYVSILFSGVIILLLVLAFHGNIQAIASIFNFGTLLTFVFIHLSLMKLRKIQKDSPRLHRVPFYPFLPILGVISCVGLMFFLSTTAKIASLVWGIVGLSIYFFNQRVKKC